MSTFSIAHFILASVLLAATLLVLLPRGRDSKTRSRYLVLGMITLLGVPILAGSLSSQRATGGEPNGDDILRDGENFASTRLDSSAAIDGMDHPASAPTEILLPLESEGSPSTPRPGSKWTIEIPPHFKGILVTVLVIWLVGIVWKGTGIAFSLARARRSQVYWRRIEDRTALEEFDTVVGEIGMPREVVLYEGPVSTPLCTGILRPRVVLPAGQVSELQRDDLRMIFAHELTHIRQGDLLWAWVKLTLDALHWWNPLAKRLCHEFSQAREELCDLVAVDLSCPRSYGQLLLNMSSQQPQNRYPAALTMAGDRNSLKERLMKLQNDKQTKSVLSPLFLNPVACVLALSPMLCHLAPAADPPRANVNHTARESQLPFDEAKIEKMAEGDGEKHYDFIHKGRNYRLVMEASQSERATNDELFLYGRVSGKIMRLNGRTGRYDVRIDSERGDSKRNLRVTKSGKKFRVYPIGSTGAANFSGIKGYKLSIDFKDTILLPTTNVASESVAEFKIISYNDDAHVLHSVEFPLSWLLSADPKSPNGIGFDRTQ